MVFVEKVYAKFRRMSTPAIMAVITAKFLFGLGLGAALAGPHGSKGRKAGGLIMLATTLLSLPFTAKVLAELDEE